ncbi:hypothetical protein WD019_15855 [Fictibacillus sp. Mic-4]|uniref:hypothetical protein n=1 Tax=Fictibacillus sp. Mic-4 TaxID=3132826 RepID=UPI003CF3CF5D
MLIASSYDELKNAQLAIEKLNATKPSIHKKFLNVIRLTRQLQFGYQFMGSLLMDEEPGKFQPRCQDDYVLSIYRQEIEKLKTDERFSELKQLLDSYKQISYANISKLALGEEPAALVGPTVIH